MCARQASYKTCFFASTWSCRTDPLGQNINHSHTSSPPPSLYCATTPQHNVLDRDAFALLCPHAQHKWSVGHPGPGSRFLPLAKGGFCCLRPTNALFHLNVVDGSQELVAKNGRNIWILTKCGGCVCATRDVGD